MIEVSSRYLDIDKIACSGQCFRFVRTDVGRYSLIAGNRLLLIDEIAAGVGAEEEPSLRAAVTPCRYRFACTDQEYRDHWVSYFDFDTDYEVFERAVDPEDAYLVAAADFCRGVRILRQDLWEVMVSFLISQNNNIPRISRSIEMLCEAFGERHDTPQGIYHGFPTPEALADEASLGDFGLGYRTPYIAQLAQEVICGDFDLAELAATKDLTEVHERLLALSGVGPKVAACIELFGLHRLAAYPIDTWVSKAQSRYRGGKFPWSRYAGFEGVVQQYLFFYTRQNAGKS